MSKTTTNNTSESSPGTSTGPTTTSHGAADSTLIGDSMQTSQNDTVGFISEGVVQTAVHHRPKALTSLLSLMKAPEDKPHTIQDYLSRPIKIDSFLLGGSDVRGAVFKNYNIMNTLKTAGCFAPARRKLQGFFGFTAKAHLKIVVNAQPFESGIYQILFAPLFKGFEQDQFYPMTAPGSIMGSEENRIPFCSGLPNKIFNIAQHSEAELAVGYVGPNMFLNLVETEDTSDFGDFFLQCLAPLASGDNNPSADCNVYMYFTEVQVFGAAQSFAQGPSDSINFKVPTEDSEAKGGGTGSVSGLAEQLASIPLLEALQPEATFALKAGAQLARQFGFSKPNASENHERMAITPYGQVSNIDGTSNAFKLGASTDQNIAVQPFGVTEEDEMSINYIVRKPTYLTSFEWTTTMGQNTNITYLPCNPNNNLWNGNTYFPTLLFFVAQFFQFWRGSLNFTFHVAATKFHSGRLRFTYDLDSHSTPSVCDQSGLHYGKIVDIRDATTFTINVPYMATTPWRQVPNRPGGNVAPNWNITPFSQFKGAFTDNCLYVSVESNLRAPSTASSSVRVLVYVSAGDDFELSGPSIGDYSFINRAYNRDAIMSKKVEEEEAKRELPKPRVERCSSIANLADYVNNRRRAQGPNDTPESTDDIPVISMVTQSPTSRSVQLAASTITMGEKFVSLRQLTKRYQKIGQSGSLTGDSSMLLLPFNVTQSITNFTNDYQLSRTFLDRVQVLYRFWRGGIRYIIQPAFQSGNFLVQYTPGDWPWDQNLKGKTGFGKMCPLHWLYKADGTTIFSASDIINHPETTTFPVIQNLQGGVELQFPYYCRFPFTPYYSQREYESIEQYRNHVMVGKVPSGQAIIGYEGPTITAVGVFRSAADDFSCGYLLGAPICTQNATFNYKG